MDETNESLLNEYLLSPVLLKDKERSKQSISINLLSPIGAISNHNTGLNEPSTSEGSSASYILSNAKVTPAQVNSRSGKPKEGNISNGASGSNITPWNEPALSQQTKRKFITGYSSTSRRPKYH